MAKKQSVDLDWEIMDACDYYSNEWIYGNSTISDVASMIVSYLSRDKGIKTTKTKVLKVLNEQWR
jgi:hypothetical protein